MKNNMEELFDDMWATTRFVLENSEYCKAIREDDSVPAFRPALCDKCIEKKCKFRFVCVQIEVACFEEDR